jgi:hypothetical protein
MNKYRVLLVPNLDADNAATGRTVHRAGAETLPAPVRLVIAQYDDQEDYYLIHFDGHGREITDTRHDSIADAMGQADWELQVKPEQWQRVIQN